MIDSSLKKISKALEKDNSHIFLTGNAGTGKSTLIDYYRNSTTTKTVILAPTGVAAVNIKGETIHSFFKFPPNVYPEKARQEARNCKNKKIYQALDSIIIDEISMVRADLFDSIDQFLKVARGNNEPFGGARVILVGDLHQLPPVVTSEDKDSLSQAYETPYFFSSFVFSQITQSLFKSLKYINLTKIFRQEEKEFIDLLNRIRENNINDDDLERINKQQIFEDYELDDSVYLATQNYLTDKINETELAKIETPEKQYLSYSSNKFSQTHFPSPQTLRLKIGARVMTQNNDSKDRWINGTLGRVSALELNSVRVLFDNGREETIEPYTWNSYRSVYNRQTDAIESEITGSYTQIPLKLAWAVTIHKSQGQTFDKVIVDLGRGAFAHGQLYVALSRCKTLGGIRLVRPITRNSIITDQQVTSFLKAIKEFE